MRSEIVPSGVIHRDLKEDKVYIDDHPIRDGTLPRHRIFKNTLFYASSTVTTSDLVSLMRPGDRAYGPSVGNVVTSRIFIDNRQRDPMQIVSASAWDVLDVDPNVVSDKIQNYFRMTKNSDLRFGSTPGSTIMDVWNKYFDGVGNAPKMAAMPARFRTISDNARYGGPLIMARAGAVNAAHIDIKGAYLHRLYMPVPVVGYRDGKQVGGYNTWEYPEWDEICDLTGFAECTVNVRETLGHDIGALPVRMQGDDGIFYPLGKVRGTWPIQLIRNAEIRGEVEVLYVHQFAHATLVEPFFSEFADFVALLPKDLGKMLYTRFIGKMASSGGFVAVKSDTVIEGTIPRSGLYWLESRVEPYARHVRATYRPDISANILAANYDFVISTVRSLKPKSVIATHIDAIWTDDIEGAKRVCAGEEGKLGSWQYKREGWLRHYGIGMYNHNNRLVCSGYNSAIRGSLTAQTLETFASSVAKSSRGGQGKRPHIMTETESPTGDDYRTEYDRVAYYNLTRLARRWSSDPAIDPSATSEPHVGDFVSMGMSDDGYSKVHSEHWSPNGHFRNERQLREKILQIKRGMGLPTEEEEDALLALGGE